jgi:hypothetical protein
MSSGSRCKRQIGLSLIFAGFEVVGEEGECH